MDDEVQDCVDYMKHERDDERIWRNKARGDDNTLEGFALVDEEEIEDDAGQD